MRMRTDDNFGHCAERWLADALTEGSTWGGVTELRLPSRQGGGHWAELRSRFRAQKLLRLTIHDSPFETTKGLGRVSMSFV